MKGASHLMKFIKCNSVHVQSAIIYVQELTFVKNIQSETGGQ